MKCECEKKKVFLQKNKLNALERFHKGELIMLLIRCEGIMCKRFWGNYKTL